MSPHVRLLKTVPLLETLKYLFSTGQKDVKYVIKEIFLVALKNADNTMHIGIYV